MFYHIRRLRQIRQIRHLVSRAVLMQLVTSLVLSCLDYCNAVLAGLPSSTLAPLQHAQNAAARLALGLDRRSYITTALQKLHWLPVNTVSPSKLLLSCVRLSTIDVRRTSLTLSCLLQPTPTSLLHYSSRCRQTKQYAVRKACLLSGRPRHMEQSSRHHPYHRLPPSLPSCAQDTSVPLSI